MGWLSKIFKGSNHKISVRQYSDHVDGEAVHSRPSASLDDLSEIEKEDIELAIALSLTEEEHRKANTLGSGSHLELEESEDEEHRGTNGLDNETRIELEDEEHRRANTLDNVSHIQLSEDEDEEHASTLHGNQCHLKEDEELARALQDSGSNLGEDEQLAKALHDNASHLEEDEQLARALQESLKANSPPRENGQIYPPMPSYFSSGSRICAGCNTGIGHGRFLSCMGSVWHPECFCCHACNQPISDYEFSMSGNHPYHKSCYKENYHPKCDVCKSFIPTNLAGLIEYRAHPFWLQKYCPSHELDGTPRCCSCERMELMHERKPLSERNFPSPHELDLLYKKPRDIKYVKLDDGRELCLECLDSAVMDTNECQPLYLEIQEFYEGLNMKIEQQVPLLLVERQALNEAMEGEKQGHHHLPETRGLCLSEEQTVSTILRRPRIGAGNQVIEMITEPYRLTRRCEVTAILILYGLPRLLTGSILAHEMMHAWLRLQGYRALSQEVEEGICQVLAHMWLDSEIMSGSSSNIASTSSSSASRSSKKASRSQFERKLGDFFKHQIESDTSAAYGDGFRAGNQAVLRYGLRSTLDHILLTGSFPC